MELPRKTTQKISAIQTRIVDFLSYNTKASRGEIATYISNITEDGVKYHLKALQNKGIINISLGFISHRMSIVERLGGFWWCKGMLFILCKDYGESMCEVSAKRVCMITLLSLSHFMQNVWKQR